MFRVSLAIAVIIFTANVSRALDWRICYYDLEDIRKVAAVETDAGNLAAASNLAIKLNDLYNNFLIRKYEYDACKTSADGTVNCVYTQRKLNTVIDEYKTERGNFHNLMKAWGKYTESSGEPCGFVLNMATR